MHIEQLLWTSGERIRTETWDQGHRPEPMNLGCGPGVWGPVEGSGELGPAVYQRQSVRGTSPRGSEWRPANR